MAWCLQRLIYTYGLPYGVGRNCVICGKEVHPVGWLAKDEYGRVGIIHESCAYLVPKCK